MYGGGMIWNVYIIRFPNAKKYIGVTKHSVDKRVHQHIASSRSQGRTTLANAIRNYGYSSLRWGCVARCYSEAEAKQLEVEYIKELDTLRPNGYNSTIGGNGVIDPSGMSERIRVLRMKKTMSADSYKRKQNLIQRKVWTEEMKQKRSKQVLVLWSNKKYREQQHLSHYKPDAKCHHKVLLTPEEKSQRFKEIWNRPGYRERQSVIHKQSQNTVECRQRASEQMKRLMADPIYRQKHAERMRIAMNKPEVRLKCSVSHLKNKKEAVA